MDDDNLIEIPNSQTNKKSIVKDFISKYLKLIVFLLILICSLSFVLVYYQKNNDGIITVDTSNWTTYTNQLLNFEFKYPSNEFELKSGSGVSLELGDFDKSSRSFILVKEGGSIPFYILSKETVSNEYFLEDLDGCDDIKIETKYINNVKMDFYSGKNCSVLNSVVIHLKDDYLYSFVSNEINLPILNTFRFLEKIEDSLENIFPSVMKESNNLVLIEDRESNDKIPPINSLIPSDLKEYVSGKISEQIYVKKDIPEIGASIKLKPIFDAYYKPQVETIENENGVEVKYISYGISLNKKEGLIYQDAKLFDFRNPTLSISFANIKCSDIELRMVESNVKLIGYSTINSVPFKVFKNNSTAYSGSSETDEIVQNKSSNIFFITDRNNGCYSINTSFIYNSNLDIVKTQKFLFEDVLKTFKFTK